MELLDTIRTAECRSLAKAWQRWRDGNLLPRRDHIKIGEIKRLLPGITILELHSADELIFRLAGTMITETLGIELTGRNYLDFAPKKDRARRGGRAMAQGRQPCGALFLLPIPFPSGRVVPTEVLSLPCLPKNDGEPIQLITMNCALDSTTLLSPAANPERFSTANEFRFVDIGAGTPDASSGLADLEAVQLFNADPAAV